MSASGDWDDDSSYASSSTDSTIDEDELNVRVYPDWITQRHIIECSGVYRLDTRRDVREHYEQYCPSQENAVGYQRACGMKDDDELCRDAGLPENLFRGSRVSDSQKIVIKAVNLRSREWFINKSLGSSPKSKDPMNHQIPILDMIEAPDDEIGFIVMEEWSPQLINGSPCCLRLFLGAMQQCIDHTVFMHRHHIAHLDISLHNIVTDDKGHYAYIDYENSRQYECDSPPPIEGYRGTEVPPECERGECSDPFKIDVWALGVLILRACQLTGYHVPELLQLIRPMLNDHPDKRPTALMVQKAFDSMLPRFSEDRLQVCMKDSL